jgi:hypothetical protein
MYIGRYKIQSETPIDTKFVKISFERVVEEKEDGTKIDFQPMDQVFSIKMKEKIQTEEINNELTKLRETRCLDIINLVLSLLYDNNVYIEEINYIFEKVHEQIKTNARKASDYVWGVEDYNVTMWHINDALSKFIKQTQKDIPNEGEIVKE